MAFRKGEIYVARRTFTTYEMHDGNEASISFEKGSQYECGENRELKDVVTGEVYHITNHVSERSDWYFDRKGDFNPARNVPQRVEYVYALLKHADGFALDELYAIAEKEKFGPLEAVIKKDNFSRILTEVQSKYGVYMRDTNGDVVVGVDHGKRYCTFHLPDKQKVA